MNWKLLVIGDDPTLETGFARLNRNLLSRWAESGLFARIDIWAIGHRGYPGKAGRVSRFHREPFVMYQAGGYGELWHERARLKALLEHVRDGDYTHVWMVQDHFLLVKDRFMDSLHAVTRAKGARLFYYAPVDGPMRGEWSRAAEMADWPVAYTQYGKWELERWLGRGFCPIEVLPHGVDTGIYRPLGRELRAGLRKKWLGNWVRDGDILLINVNVNQRRKDVARSLEMARELNPPGSARYKLLMHMSREDAGGEGVDLEAIGEGLGLTRGVEWDHSDRHFQGPFRGGTLSEEELNELYQCADAYLTTSLGEGWGFGMTEAMAAGLPVFCPDHTACGELAGRVNAFEMNAPGDRLYRFFTLPLEAGGVVLPVDNSVMRRRADLKASAQRIASVLGASRMLEEGVEAWRRRPLADGVREWLSWDRIAGEWLKLFEREQRVRHIYIEWGGGLGDVINAMATHGSYGCLDKIAPLEAGGPRVTVGVVSHNPNAFDVLRWHPGVKSGQVTALELPYWGPEVWEDRAARERHGLPRGGSVWRLPDLSGSCALETAKFYMREEDERGLARLRELTATRGGKGYVVVAAGAGLPDRNVPTDLALRVMWQLAGAGYWVVVRGSTYDRHGRFEPPVGRLFRERHSELAARVVDLTDQMKMPADLELVRGSSGVVTAHSSFCLMSWHMRKPTLVMYPESTRARHFRGVDGDGEWKRDEWNWGMEEGMTVAGCFDGVDGERVGEMVADGWAERFMEVMFGDRSTD